MKYRQRLSGKNWSYQGNQAPLQGLTTRVNPGKLGSLPQLPYSNLYLFSQADIQLPQLGTVHRTWGVGKQTGGRLGFREGDDIADGFTTQHQHHQPIQAKGQAAVGGATVFERIEQKAEFLPKKKAVFRKIAKLRDGTA